MIEKSATNALWQEQIDLEDLQVQARLDETKASSRTILDLERSMIILVKKPLVAIRYKLHDMKVVTNKSHLHLTAKLS